MRVQVYGRAFCGFVAGFGCGGRLPALEAGGLGIRFCVLGFRASGFRV